MNLPKQGDILFTTKQGGIVKIDNEGSMDPEGDIDPNKILGFFNIIPGMAALVLKDFSPIFLKESDVSDEKSYIDVLVMGEVFSEKNALCYETWFVDVDG